MAFPGYPLPDDKTNVTAQQDDHPDHHNALAVAVNDLQDQADVLTNDVANLAGIAAAAIPIGGMSIYAGANDPSAEWLIADGRLLTIAAYPALYARIGTTYGSAGGSFAIPDMRGRFPLGVATSGTGDSLGDTGGQIDHVHGLDTPSSHARVSMSATSAPNFYMQRKTAPGGWNATHANGWTGGASGDSTANSLGAALGGDTDDANPPYIALNYIIRVL